MSLPPAVIVTLKVLKEDGTERTPYVPSRKILCEECDEEVWISKSSLPLKMPAMCVECVRELIEKEKACKNSK